MHTKTQQLFFSLGLACFGVALFACDLDDKDIGETGAETGDGDGDSTGDGDGDSTGDGDGDPTGDGDGDPTGDGDGDPTGECSPPDPSISFELEAGPFELQNQGEADVDSDCTVLANDPTTGLHLELDCPGQQETVVVDVTSEPAFSLSVDVGELVHLRYLQITPWWTNTFMRLDDSTGQHLLTIVDADDVVPFDAGVSFTLPTGISKEFGVCPFGDEGCGPVERVRLGFDNEGTPVELFDGSHAVIPDAASSEVWLTMARSTEDSGVCLDLPFGWYRLLIVGDQQ